MHPTGALTTPWDAPALRLSAAVEQAELDEVDVRPRRAQFVTLVASPAWPCGPETAMFYLARKASNHPSYKTGFETAWG